MQGSTVFAFAAALSFSTLLLTSAAIAEQRPAVAEKMAKTAGIDSWGQVEGIRFTFNVERGDVKVARAWEWEPKTDTVTYEGKDKDGKPVKVTYKRSQADAPEDIDANYLNDQYWLLLPFHVIWDTSATVTDEGNQKLPLGNESGEKLVMKYSSDGGYSPGDTWDIYVGADGRVQEFVYHRGGPKKPSTVIAPWTDFKKAGPLLFSLDHQGKADDTPAHIFFTNVAVKVAGSNTWMDAK